MVRVWRKGSESVQIQSGVPIMDVSTGRPGDRVKVKAGDGGWKRTEIGEQVESGSCKCGV